MKWRTLGSSADPQRFCDETALQELLQGRLDEKRQRRLIKHLTHCTHCQAVMTRLAANEKWWTDATAVLRNGVTDDADEDFEFDHDRFSLEQELSDWGVIEPSDLPESIGKLDRYEIRGIIGAGGTGVVMKAFDRELGRVVAIKMLAPALAANGPARRRFAREAQAAAAVVHDNVVSVHHVEASGRSPYLVMQFIDGESLQEHVMREGPVDVATALRLTMQAADALDAAHSQGMVHRDIKPANLMLASTGQRLWVTDFGLARAVDDASLTRTGFIAGTPHYMSPEQARGESVGPRSDLFSMGGTLFFMLTGRVPFRADRTLAILSRICTERHHHIRDINADVPQALVDLIDRLLAKEPAARVESAGVLRRISQEMLEQLQDGTLGARTTPRPRRFRRRWIGGVLGAAASFAVIATAWQWNAIVGPASSSPANETDSKSSKRIVKVPDRVTEGKDQSPVRSDPRRIGRASASPAKGFAVPQSLPTADWRSEDPESNRYANVFPPSDRQNLPSLTPEPVDSVSVPIPAETWNPSADEQLRWRVERLESELSGLEREHVQSSGVNGPTTGQPDAFEEELNQLEQDLKFLVPTWESH